VFERRAVGDEQRTHLWIAIVVAVLAVRDVMVRTIQVCLRVDQPAIVRPGRAGRDARIRAVMHARGHADFFQQCM